jgi:hypothetical protein
MAIETTQLDLSDANGEFSVSWYNPREGGELQKAEIQKVTGGDLVTLGNPPADADKDWVVLVKK